MLGRLLAEDDLEAERLYPPREPLRLGKWVVAALEVVGAGSWYRAAAVRRCQTSSKMELATATAALLGPRRLAMRVLDGGVAALGAGCGSGRFDEGAA